MECRVDFLIYKDVIIIRDFKKGANVQCIIDTWNYILEHNMITPTTKGVISDYRNCDIDCTVEEISNNIQNFHKENPEILSKVKLAHIIDTPDIVYSMLFDIEHPRDKSRSFSTLCAAKQWMLK